MPQPVIYFGYLLPQLVVSAMRLWIALAMGLLLCLLYETFARFSYIRLVVALAMSDLLFQLVTSILLLVASTTWYFYTFCYRIFITLASRLCYRIFVISVGHLCYMGLLLPQLNIFTLHETFVASASRFYYMRSISFAMSPLLYSSLPNKSSSKACTYIYYFQVGLVYKSMHLFCQHCSNKMENRY